MIFPNIAGRWEGTIHSIREGQAAKAAASLDVEQNLNVVSLVLQTDNADSETIVVYSIPQISLFVGRLTDLDIASNAAGDIVEIKSARRDPLQIDPLPARDAQASTTIT